MMEALVSSETALTKAARHNIGEHGILHNHRRENIRSYILEIHLRYTNWYISWAGWMNFTLGIVVLSTPV
jgi:hypothetical protein